MVSLKEWLDANAYRETSKSAEGYILELEQHIKGMTEPSDEIDPNIQFDFGYATAVTDILCFLRGETK